MAAKRWSALGCLTALVWLSGCGSDSDTEQTADSVSVVLDGSTFDVFESEDKVCVAGEGLADRACVNTPLTASGDSPQARLEPLGGSQGAEANLLIFAFPSTSELPDPEGFAFAHLSSSQVTVGLARIVEDETCVAYRDEEGSPGRASVSLTRPADDAVSETPTPC